MKAKLYIKGIKEPKNLSEEEGKAAEALMADPESPHHTPFIVEGVWSGTKADMRYIDWEKETVYVVQESTALTSHEKMLSDQARKETREFLKARGII